MAKANGAAEHSAASCVRSCFSFVADNHWSSTENSSTNAWKLNFNNGNQNNNNKTNNKRVRAFRKWLTIPTILVLLHRRTFLLLNTIVAAKNATHGARFDLRSA